MKGGRAGHASRSSDLLRVEASLAMLSQSGLNAGRGATIGGACGTITEVASELSLRTCRCDGLRQTLLPYFYHFKCIRL
jgi:hypothetical protein